MTSVDVEVRVRAPVRATEDPSRVETAVRNLFPDAELRVEETQVRGVARSLAHLEDLVNRHQIPDSARVAMLRGREKFTGVSRFRLGKQAAYMGKPNFDPPQSALGDVEVELVARDDDALVLAIYETALDTTVAPDLARLPPSLRPVEETETADGPRE